MVSSKVQPKMLKARVLNSCMECQMLNTGTWNIESSKCERAKNAELQNA